MLFHNSKKERQRQREFYQHTKENEGAGRRDLRQPTNLPNRTEASNIWLYRAPAIALTVAAGIGAPVLVQTFLQKMYNLGKPPDEVVGFFHDFGFTPVYALWVCIGVPIIGGLLLHKFTALWRTNNAMLLSDGLEEHQNDAYLRTLDHICSEFDAAPDAGLGFDGHVSSIVGHMMVSNKGIKKIDMPQFDPDVPGQVARNADGTVKTKKMELFDKDFGRELYKFSNVDSSHQMWHDATDYAFNEKNSKKEAKFGNARKGAFGRKAYDTLADYINGEFYPLETDTQRPAGVYFYDSRPVNTILIAITRGGKGQTFIGAIRSRLKRSGTLMGRTGFQKSGMMG